MERIVSKRKTQEIEEAEIVISNNSKDDDTKSSDKRYNSKSNIIILYILVFISFAMLSALLIYYQKKGSEQFILLQDELKAMEIIVSSETMDKKMSDLELLLRREYVSILDKEVKEIESNLLKNIDSLIDSKQSETVLNLVQDEVLKLQVNLEKKISALSAIDRQNSEYLNTKVIEATNFQSQLDNLGSDFQNDVNGLKTRLKAIEKQFILSTKRLIELESLILSRTNKNSTFDLESLDELRDSFVEIAHEALKMEAQKNIVGNPWSKFTSTIKSLFIFRSTHPRDGVDTDSILSRAEQYLKEGNFDDCLKELDNIDTDLGVLFYDWKKQLNRVINKTN
tara:strand:+ start:529 stop:1545 length:1017 start_codon:yes stop_codon:yes gene_type:complete